MAHSLGGGTGSGMGTLLLLNLKDNYPKKSRSTFSVFPSPKVSHVVVEPYNAVLTSRHLIENVDETFVIDNESLHSIIHNVFKQKELKWEPNYDDYNWITTMVMSGVTAPLRFPTQPRYNSIDLVPYPRLHFLNLSQAPLFKQGSDRSGQLFMDDLTDQMWSDRNSIANIKSEDGKYIGSSCIYRGYDINENESNSRTVDMNKVREKMADNFIRWSTDKISFSTVKVLPEEMILNEMSGTMIANTTAMKGIFQRLASQYSKMYRRKAFLHWHKGEGMDEMEFQESDKAVRDLITEYQDKQDWLDDDEEDSDEYSEEDEEEEEDF